MEPGGSSALARPGGRHEWRETGGTGPSQAGAVQVVLVLGIAGVVAAVMTLLGLGGLFTATSEASGGAPSDLHPIFADAYLQAAMRARDLAPPCQIRPTVLAGVGRVEFPPGNTDGGKDVDVSPDGVVQPPVYGPPTDFGSAEGPMQFLPSTWATSGLDAAGTVAGDGITDPQNIYDAALSAAVYLCRAVPGSTLESDEDLLRAFYSYNHSKEYAQDVLHWVHYFDDQAASAVVLHPQGGADTADLLNNPRLVLTDEARSDLANGIVDPRVVAVVRGIVASHTIAVSVFKTGHSRTVEGTDRVSNHWGCDGPVPPCYGRAVDIYRVDDEDVSATSSAAVVLVQELIAARTELAIDEIGQPFAEFVVSGPGHFRVFTDASHQDHVHIGIDP